MQEALRDATITFLKTLDLNVPAAHDLYHKQMKQLKQVYPTHLPLLLEHLRKLDSQVCDIAAGSLVVSFFCVLLLCCHLIALESSADHKSEGAILGMLRTRPKGSINAADRL